MTLVAIRVHGDRAQVLTDTLTYDNAATTLGHCSKARVFPHLSAVTVGKGPGELGDLWTWRRSVDWLNGFDTWHDIARAELPLIWESIAQSDRWGPGEEGHIYNVGWSPARGRFVAYEYASTDGFTGRELPGMFGNPPVDGEPVSDAEWVDYAEAVYATWTGPLRRMREGCVIIGGDLILTEVTRGAVTQRRIHTFRHDDQRFRRMLIGTAHRLGQLGPCLCGSGQPAIVCHDPVLLPPDGPCPCGGGRLFADCHLVDITSPAGIATALAHLKAHRDDYTVEREQMAAAWRKRYPMDKTPPPPQIIPA